MRTLWALASILALQVEALTLLSPPPVLQQLPVGNLPVRRRNVYNYPTVRRAARTAENRPQPQKRECYPMARYFMSGDKLRDYLNATVPPQIEKMLMCAEVDLAGLLGTVLETVTDLDLLSLLDITSSLDILGGGGLGGILGKGSSSKSSNSPQSPLSEATGVTNLLPQAQGILNSITPNDGQGPDDNASRGSSLLQPLSAVGNKVGELIESTKGVLESVVPAGITDGLLGGLGNIDLKDLLIGLEVQKATVENMKLTMTGDGILVQATTTAFVAGKGLLGAVLSILGFQVNSDVTLKIGISTNNAQCVNLQVQDRDIRVKEVNLLLVKAVTDALPVSLPLDDIVSEVLTVDMNENIKKSKSCDIDFSDFNECKSSTGLFTYHIKSFRTSAQGLSILYCAFFKEAVPMPGSPLPPIPKNANVSITLSRTMVRAVVIHSAKQSSIQMNDLGTQFARIVYSSQPDNKVQNTYWVNVTKDGESFATGQTNLIVSYTCKILKGKLKVDVKIESFEHSMTPPDTVS
ncbi:vomeromodulin [Rhinolophus sinicus]|uniref:vomeromodulin n=1 Tax=Rhinolophus sinicus TaxID=89399 RepID=UPI003D7B39F5